MVTVNKIGNRPNTAYLTLYGNSEDNKPTDRFEGTKILNGSEFIEIDTGKRYVFDEENLFWEETTEGGGISSIPVATRTTLGGVIIGDGLSADDNGVLSVIGGEASTLLYNNGEFYNQDIADVVYDSNTNWVIENGRLILSRKVATESAGLLVRTKSGTTGGIVTVECELLVDDPISGWQTQTGRCTENATFPSIVSSGTNRITYNNDSGWGKEVQPIKFKLGQLGNTDSVFIGITSTSQFSISIKRVYITQEQTVIVH